mmetsp:Transcript_51563/g.122798  ORF Transcript_51563/g.122798 Transcript_51563/m.122798 type:complete len:253 (+) Transcript_51563:297-1055(+)
MSIVAESPPTMRERRSKFRAFSLPPPAASASSLRLGLDFFSPLAFASNLPTLPVDLVAMFSAAFVCPFTSRLVGLMLVGRCAFPPAFAISSTLRFSRFFCFWMRSFRSFSFLSNGSTDPSSLGPASRIGGCASAEFSFLLYPHRGENSPVFSSKTMRSFFLFWMPLSLANFSQRVSGFAMGTGFSRGSGVVGRGRSASRPISAGSEGSWKRRLSTNWMLARARSSISVVLLRSNLSTGVVLNAASLPRSYAM